MEQAQVSGPANGAHCHVYERETEDGRFLKNGVSRIMRVQEPCASETGRAFGI